MATKPGRMVIVSGPSCVGKSPLEKALAKFYPELREKLQALILFNSRTPRPGERDGVDYHFRTRDQINALRDNPRYTFIDVRGDLQALDLEALHHTLANGDALFEGNPFVGRILQTHPSLAEIKKISIFIAPLSREEICYLQAPERNANLRELVTDVMRRKLLRRTTRQKLELSLKDLENIEKRAGSAYDELKEAHHFQWVIPNHDGEDSFNWDAFYYPLGDARKTLLALAALLKGDAPGNAERWEAGLIP